MMKTELEKLAGCRVTTEDYNLLEQMYNATSLSKADFVKTMQPTIKTMAKKLEAEAEAQRRANQKTVFISDGRKTPNHCYYYGGWAKLVDIDLNGKGGKPCYKIRRLTEEEEREHYQTHGLDTAYHYDILYDTDCMSVKLIG